MVPIVTDIFATIKNGFQDRALMMLRKHKQYLSKRDIYELWKDPAIESPVKEFLYVNCLGEELIQMTRDRENIHTETITWLNSNATVLMHYNPHVVGVHEQLNHIIRKGDGERKLMKALLTHYENNPTSVVILHSAVIDAFVRGDTKIIKLFWTRKYPHFGHSPGPFWAACANGHAKAAKYTLTDGKPFCEVEHFGRGARMRRIIEGGHITTIKLVLLNSDTRYAIEYEYVFKMALKQRHMAMIKMLLTDDYSYLPIAFVGKHMRRMISLGLE